MRFLYSREDRCHMSNVTSASRASEMALASSCPDCTFRRIDAGILISRVEHARENFDAMLKARKHLSLLSEDMYPLHDCKSVAPAR